MSHAVEKIGLDTYLHSLEPTNEDGVPVLFRHRPPDETFLHELENPHLTEIGGQTYASYIFNRDKVDETKPPVLVSLASILGTPTHRYGALAFNAFATQTDRPIIAIDRPGSGGASVPNTVGIARLTLDKIATDNVRVLEDMEVDRVDLAGTCIGATLMAKVAVCLGGRARSLHTFAAVGFRPDVVRRSANGAKVAKKIGSVLPLKQVLEVGVGDIVRQSAELEQPMRALSETDLPHGVAKVERMVFRRLGLSANGAKLRNLPTALAPETTWYDYDTTTDYLSDWRDHQKTIEARNQLHPGSSHLTVIEGVNRDIFALRTLHTARAVARNLSEAN